MLIISAGEVAYSVVDFANIWYKGVYVEICQGRLWNKQASPVKRDVVSQGSSILNPAHARALPVQAIHGCAAPSEST